MSGAVPTAPPWPEADADADKSPSTCTNQDRQNLDQLAAQIGLNRPVKPGEALELGFICPLTLEVFEDCVQASDGHTYEREAIEGWMRKNMTSPMTRQALVKTLTPNSVLLRQIRAWEQAQENYELEAAKYESTLMEVFNVGNAAMAKPVSRMHFALATEFPFGRPLVYASHGKQSAKEYVSRGDKCLRNNDPAGAERWYGKAATSWPDFHEGSFKLGRVLLQQNKRAAALVFLHQAVKAGAAEMTGARHNFTLGELLVQLGHLEEACYYLKAAVALQPAQPLYKSALGVALFKQGSLQEALPHVTQAAGLLPGNAACLGQLGEILSALKLHAQAETALRRASQLRPDNAAYQHSLGLALFSQGNIAAALQSYNEAVRLNPRCAAAVASRGDAHLASGDVAAARSDFLTAARLETANPRYLYSLACALYSQHNLPEALHFAGEAVRRDHGRNGMYKALVENLQNGPTALKKPSNGDMPRVTISAL